MSSDDDMPDLVGCDSTGSSSSDDSDSDVDVPTSTPFIPPTSSFPHVVEDDDDDLPELLSDSDSSSASSDDSSGSELIFNGSGTIGGKHVHYTIGVKGRDLLNCYASVESHTFWYNLLCNVVKKGFSYGDHTR